MELRRGYKQTDLGVFPVDWETDRLGRYWRVIDCKHVTAKFTADGFPVASIMEVQSQFVDLSDANYTTQRFYNLLTEGGRKPRVGDLILSRNATVGEVAQVAEWHPPFAMGQDVCLLRKKSLGFSTNYLQALFGSSIIKRQFIDLMVGSTFKRVNVQQVRDLAIVIPAPAEQDHIAEVLRDTSAFIESLEQLITKKRQLRQGAMHALLLGKNRLPGFTAEWKVRRIAEIASPCSERNSAGDSLPVLTCSKHSGFVDSLAYFKNQVFSRDTRDYKVIKRSQIGYPSNHVEEGSIGLQEIYDVALVSPIYVVFSVAEGVSAYFLHRLLKLDVYRQKFETATSASVDRRGSLRWPAFSEITVNLPPFEEQVAVAAILRDMDAEVVVLETKLRKTRQIKQGMMNELLMGRIRVV